MAAHDMTIDTPADIVFRLAQEMASQGASVTLLSRRTNIPVHRLELLQSGAWENLTLREITTVSEALGVDLLHLLN